MKIKDAQEFVKSFAIKANWDDSPCIDKFDHLHEELIEMSKLLRYKDKEKMVQVINENNEQFKDGMGDLFFATCRLANQLNIDLEDSFNFVKYKIVKRFTGITESEAKEKQNL